MTPGKRKKVSNQSRTKSKKLSPKKGNRHIQIPPSYLDYPVSDEEENVSFEPGTKRKLIDENERYEMKSEITENQLECIDGSIDSNALWSQMGKMTQPKYDEIVTEVDNESDSDRYESTNIGKNRNIGRGKHVLNSNSCSDNDTRTNTDRQGNSGDKGMFKSVKNRNIGHSRHERDTDIVRTRVTIDHKGSVEETNIGLKSVMRKQRAKENNRIDSKRTKVEIDDNVDSSQGSVLDDFFGKSGADVKPKRKPAPSKSKMAKSLASTVDKNYEKDSGGFKVVDEIFASNDSDSDVKLETSTLKDDDYDCFDDPRKWKKRKEKSDKKSMSAIDKLISESETDFNNLFTTGKMKRKETTYKQDREKSPVRTCDRSPSLFSF